MNKEHLELYTDYLLSTFGYATATGLSAMVNGQVSHDQITRFLSGEEYTSKDLWQEVKTMVRKIEREDAVLIFDDTVQEKPYTDENEVMSWHYDHSQDRSVKGINFVTCLYHASGYSLPVGFSIVAKTEYYIDKKEGKQKRRSAISKNEYYRQLLTNAKHNHIPFQYVLSDVWYSAAENMMFIKHDLDKDFVMPLKANRKVALSQAARRNGQWVRLDQLTLEANTCTESIWKVSISRSCFSSKSSQTKMAVPVFSIWCPAIAP